MKISKQDALTWFRFFAALPPEETLPPRQQEIALAVFSQLEDAQEAVIARMQKAIPGLKTLEDRTVYVGPDHKFAKGCKSCLLGSGLGAVRKTNRCNLRCPFCYDFGHLQDMAPVGEDCWEIGGTKYRTADLPLLLRESNRPTGIAYVYLEPFMEIEAYYPAIRAFHQAGVYQHMYTNGTLATPQNLRALADCGLDELRFNLGASGAADPVIEAMATAKAHIPMVGIETPMTREFEQAFMEKKKAILATGVDFINCAELHLNENNLDNYDGESLYMYRQGYISPVFSRQITCRLMAMAAEEKWDLVVHDCSNRTKFARDMHLCAREGGWFGRSAYHCEFDTPPYAAFLPALQDPALPFVQEEPLPAGYRVGEIVL